MPDITRIYKGIKHEFEVEIVFGEKGEQSPREAHPFHEIINLLDGTVTIERSDQDKASTHKAFEAIEVPAGVEHCIMHDTPVRIVILHPERVPPAI